MNEIPANNMRLNPGEDRRIAAQVINDAIARNRKDGRYASYHYPRDAAEWWHNVDTWWTELMDLAARYARTPELDCMLLKQQRDSKLASVFEETWGRAPDHASIHANKGWDVLCDLCSESYVLADEEELPC